MRNMKNGPFNMFAKSQLVSISEHLMKMIA